MARKPAKADDQLDTRIWLRLLTCTMHIENRLRNLLRVHFGTTLPRFDFMAQLDRYPEGLQMKTLSKYLMVSGGNVTSLTNALVKSGHVKRIPNLEDRRSFTVKLTAKGKKDFDAMAQKHREWLAALFKDLPDEFKHELHGKIWRFEDYLAIAHIGGRTAHGASDVTRAGRSHND